MKKTITEVETAIEMTISKAASQSLKKNTSWTFTTATTSEKKNTRKPDGGTTLSQRSLRKKPKKRKRIGTTTAWRND